MDKTNYKQQLIAVFHENEVSPTGEYEVTGFHDVDIAVGNLIAGAIDKARICEPNDVNKLFSDYTSRPLSDKFIVGRFDDLQRLLGHVRNADAGRVSEKGKPQVNRDALPLVNLSRNFLVSYGNTDRAIRNSNNDGQIIYTDETRKELLAVTSTIPATLTYDLMMVGPDKESTSLLCNAMASVLLSMVSTKFEAKTRMATVALRLDCGFDGLGAFMLSDSSPGDETDRLYCATTQLTVITEVVTAWNVETRRIRVGLLNPQAMDEKQ